MNIDVDGAGEGGRSGGKEVGGAVAAVPEVGGGVFVGDEEEGDGVVGGGGADCVGCGGVVFGCVGGEGFEEGGAVEGFKDGVSYWERKGLFAE